MTDSEHIRALMTEIGPAMNLAEVRQVARGGPWTLGDRDGTVVFVELMPEEDRIWLSADIGVARPEDRPRLHELMLLYNAQWKQTGGVRIVLDSPGGCIVQAYDLAASGLDLPRLSTILGNFHRTLDGWRQIVAGERAPTTDLPAMPGPGMIRG